MGQNEWVAIEGFNEQDVVFVVPKRNISMSKSIVSTCRDNPRPIVFDARVTRMFRNISLLKGDSEAASRGLAFVPKTTEAKSDLLLSWASGSDSSFYKYLRVFVLSANQYMADCTKVLLTHDMPLEQREWLQEQGLIVCDVDPDGIRCLIRDRCFKFHDFLVQNKDKYKRVLIADAKDVVFQGSIFDQYRSSWSRPGKDDEYFEFCLVFSEGSIHRDSEWNLRDQQLYQKAINAPFVCYGPWEVINGGLYFGHPTEVAKINLEVGKATLTAHNKVVCSDQAALNYLHRNDFYNENQPLLIGPHDVYLNAMVAHGDAIKDDIFQAETYWHESGLLCDEFGQKFLIFHQWDRTEYREEILKKYGLT